MAVLLQRKWLHGLSNKKSKIHERRLFAVKKKKPILAPPIQPKFMSRMEYRKYQEMINYSKHAKKKSYFQTWRKNEK